jgi:acyl CoA:acetate/3-ketoacid CoA transferase beta subunit
MTSAPATIEEIQIARMAKEYRGEVLAAGTTVLSDLATRLAKLLYDDDLILFGGGFGAYDCGVLPYVEDEEYLAHASAQTQFNWEITFDMIAADRYRIFTGPVQVDRTGATNISVIGDWAQPKVQLIGARGIPDDLWRLRRMNFHLPKHSSRSLVDRVDFVCSFGYGETRDRLRVDGVTAKEPMRPGTLVTDLGVFTWAEDTGEFRTESLHPGVSPEEVKAQTGFDIEIPSGVPTTELPTTEELSAIREVIDPWGFRTGSDETGRIASRMVGRALMSRHVRL